VINTKMDDLFHGCPFNSNRSLISIPAL
jgi:hypothetical protein